MGRESVRVGKKGVLRSNHLPPNTPLTLSPDAAVRASAAAACWLLGAADTWRWRRTASSCGEEGMGDGGRAPFGRRPRARVSRPRPHLVLVGGSKLNARRVQAEHRFFRRETKENVRTEWSRSQNSVLFHRQRPSPPSQPASLMLTTALRGLLRSPDAPSHSFRAAAGAAARGYHKNVSGGGVWRNAVPCSRLAASWHAAWRMRCVGFLAASGARVCDARGPEREGRCAQTPDAFPFPSHASFAHLPPPSPNP